ncbi:MAG TPA: hypothetical protein VKI19_09085, partial [Acidimicrobiales bacterium]|nr:hypothetical protein [Acidimicrobiales bacterium]
MPSVPAAARIRGFATGVTDAGDLIGEPLIVVPADPHGDGGGASGVVVPSGLPAVVAAVWNGPGPPPPLAPDGPDVALTVSAGLATSADVTAPWVAVEDTDHAVALLRAKVAESPAAAVALVQVLRMAGHGAVEDGLVRESLAYSMLQAGPHFARWRQARPVRDRPASAAPTVLVSRSGDVLDLLLDRPDVHNAYNRRMRD